MATLNNWMKSNLAERITNKRVDFSVDLNVYFFNRFDIQAASSYTAGVIANNCGNNGKLYLALSGGADSDYVLHTMVRCGIPVIPIIIVTSGNTMESAYAFHSCRKFAIDPIVIELTDEQFLRIYYDDILSKLNSAGVYSTPGLVACRYAADHNGTLIIGEHMIDYDSNGIFAGLNEWDFTNEALVGEQYNIPFFNYTVELSYAMVEAIEDLPIDEWKCKHYGIDFRPIIPYNFSDKTKEIIQKLMVRGPTGKSDFRLGSKQSFLQYLDKWKLNNVEENTDAIHGNRILLQNK
jgi:hypothetical protein